MQQQKLQQIFWAWKLTKCAKMGITLKFFWLVETEASKPLLLHTHNFNFVLDFLILPSRISSDFLHMLGCVLAKLFDLLIKIFRNLQNFLRAWIAKIVTLSMSAAEVKQ